MAMVKRLLEENTSNVYPIKDEFSVEQVTNHLWLLRKLQSLFDHAESFGPDASKFPLPPPGVDASDPEEGSRWRTQCLLMNAEVRYSFYLRLLRDWIEANGQLSSKKDWPLPPWDVAVIFYIHLLSPQRYFRDMSVEYPSLWKAKIEFPVMRLSKLKQHPYTDKASQAEWEKKFPGIPYQVFEFTDDGAPRLRHQRALDIRGYKCGSAACSGKAKMSTIHVADWAWYRLGKTHFARFCRAVFGGPVLGLWDAPLRQFGKGGFVERILSVSAEIQLPQAQARYLRFLQLMKAHESTTFVPTLDIDLIWHTHQLSPAAYENYCQVHVGQRINHDDTIKAAHRANALDVTKRKWALTFAELYLNPNDDGPNARLLQARQKTYLSKQSTMATQLSEYDDANKNVWLSLESAREKASEERTLDKSLQKQVQDAHAAARSKQSEMDRVKPRIRLFNLWKHYSRAAREQRAALQRERNAFRKQAADKQAELYARDPARTAADKEVSARQAEWDAVVRRREALRGKLLYEVTLAEAKVWDCVVMADNESGDPLGKGVFSVVPSDAQVMPPPVCGNLYITRRGEGRSEELRSDRIFTEIIAALGEGDGGAAEAVEGLMEVVEVVEAVEAVEVVVVEEGVEGEDVVEGAEGAVGGAN
ncbi:Glycine-rich domain-containing protein 1 [Madurella mycetomatis]|uniref:Glycine-rich domain-containing protein 1 n=1 Tax=Madurella mycetomatis TaxID=100816 RepID=A0A175VR79_9PEZI|nr:Glycine-rich domain-containing protein 1 [Madurella mycetomatis]KXX79877.1 Glycine-rich domain-containing protein 1 [Madurella mycetomatis]